MNLTIDRMLVSFAGLWGLQTQFRTPGGALNTIHQDFDTQADRARAERMILWAFEQGVRSAQTQAKAEIKAALNEGYDDGFEAGLEDYQTRVFVRDAVDKARAEGVDEGYRKGFEAGQESAGLGRCDVAYHKGLEVGAEKAKAIVEALDRRMVLTRNLSETSPDRVESHVADESQRCWLIAREILKDTQGDQQ